ncbi:MAG: hypothetical protein ACKOAW_09775 [Actinomycetota bacterium]
MTVMHRAEAAAVLGLGDRPTPDEIKRAWRLWAREAHPDFGGNESEFARLCEARTVLMEPLAGDPGVASARPAPRRAWRDVLVRPDSRGALQLACLCAMSLVAVLVASLFPMPWGLSGAAVIATATCVVASRRLLSGSDHGHVIVVRSVAWITITALQCGLAALVGIPAFEALPLLAVPFVACISLVNPGAGLWRPARPAR